MFLKLQENYHLYRTHYHRECIEIWAEHLQKQLVEAEALISRAVNENARKLAHHNARHLLQRLESYIEKHNLYVEYHEQRLDQLVGRMIERRQRTRLAPVMAVYQKPVDLVKRTAQVAMLRRP